MNKHALTKISFYIDILAGLVLIFYFLAIKLYTPVNSLGGLLVLSPPMFGLFGFITAMLGWRRNGSNYLNVVLIILNIIFLFWWPILWVGGTLLFGP